MLWNIRQKLQISHYPNFHGNESQKIEKLNFTDFVPPKKARMRKVEIIYDKKKKLMENWIIAGSIKWSRRFFARVETKNNKTAAKLNNERTSIGTSYPTDVTGPS